MVSSVAIGGSQVIHLGVELVEWGLDSARGIETPQWKLDDIKGAWENTKAIGSTLKTIGLGLQGATNPWLLAVSPTHREALKETFDMGAGIVNTIVNDIKTGNAYAIGGYVFDVASMFVGVGEVNAALKGTKLGAKIAEGLNAFKATTKATTLSKLGKVTSMMDKALKYGDDALKAFVTKLKNIPMPIMDELAIAGGGSVKVFGKGTLNDYMKAAKANFSKGSGAVDDIPKPRFGERKITDDLYNELRNQTPNPKIRKSVNKDVNLPMDDFAIPGKTIVKNLEADHIVPMDRITKMEGFEKLTKSQQLEILNYEENFIGLSKSANTSKGSKTYAEWDTYLKENIPINPKFREEMILKEKILEGKIQQMIDNMLK